MLETRHTRDRLSVDDSVRVLLSTELGEFRDAPPPVLAQGQEFKVHRPTEVQCECLVTLSKISCGRQFAEVLVATTSRMSVLSVGTMASHACRGPGSKAVLARS